MKNIMSFVALATCFNSDESLNHGALAKQVERQVRAGNHILCCGTTGEFPSLRYEEKIAVCETAVDVADGRVRVFANAGCPSTHETIELGLDMIGAGVDALPVVTPYYIACTQESLYRHYMAVADAMTIPVYLYDIPARTQNHIEPVTAARLAEHPNILGIKDSGGTAATIDDWPGFRFSRGRTRSSTTPWRRVRPVACPAWPMWYPKSWRASAGSSRPAMSMPRLPTRTRLAPSGRSCSPSDNRPR